MNIPTIDTRTLADKLKQSPDETILLHILPSAYFEAEKIPASGNACVYEMTFLDQAAKVIPSLNTPVIVYGTGDDSRASALAAEKLIAAGYDSVTNYEAGLRDWKRNGGTVEGTGALPAEVQTTDFPAGYEKRAVDPERSIIHWFGRNILSNHYGTLRLVGGEVEIDGGDLKRGEFIVDMTSMANEDISDPDLNQVLIAHLKDPDFFDVERYPTAVFSLQEAELLTVDSPGEPNARIKGNLTMKGITEAIEFEAVIGISMDNIWAAQATLEIDRTRWNVYYGSGKFFKNLGMHLVNDYITLKLVIACPPAV